MALPKLETPTYTMTLPSTGEEIKFRPFLVKEQKRLIMAQESKDNNQIFDAMSALIRECTFEKVNPDTCPLFDAEYIFLQIRGKSVGENLDLVVTCPDDDKTKVNVKVDITEINVHMTDDHTNEIQLLDDIKIVFKYPLLKDTKDFVLETDTSKVANMILDKCIDELHFGEDIYKRSDISQKELDEFVDSMSSEQYIKVMEFFNTMPKIRHVIEVTNPNTKEKGEVLLEGLQSFLA